MQAKSKLLATPSSEESTHRQQEKFSKWVGSKKNSHEIFRRKKKSAKKNKLAEQINNIGQKKRLSPMFKKIRSLIGTPCSPTEPLFRDLIVCWCLSVFVPECVCFWVYSCLSVFVSECIRAWGCLCLSVFVPECVDAWVCVWVCKL